MVKIKVDAEYLLKMQNSFMDRIYRLFVSQSKLTNDQTSKTSFVGPDHSSIIQSGKFVFRKGPFSFFS